MRREGATSKREQRQRGGTERGRIDGYARKEVKLRKREAQRDSGNRNNTTPGMTEQTDQEANEDLLEVREREKL